MGGRPHSGNQAQLAACDENLRAVGSPFHSSSPSSRRTNSPEQELANITDEAVYSELQASDMAMGRWTAEDPDLREVQRWVQSRQR